MINRYHRVAPVQFGLWILSSLMGSNHFGKSLLHYVKTDPHKEESEITKIKFINIHPPYKFIATIPVDDLKKFAVKLAQTIIDESFKEQHTT